MNQPRQKTVKHSHLLGIVFLGENEGLQHVASTVLASVVGEEIDIGVVKSIRVGKFSVV